MRIYVQGVSTGKVKQIAEELVDHSFPASAISQINKRLDAGLKAFWERRLKEAYPYLILGAGSREGAQRGHHREPGRFATGVDWEGRRQVLAVDLAACESA